jgi:biotin transporter BioY
MSDRGNKRPSLAVKVIVALIVVLGIGVLWLGIQAMQKEPHSPRQGSQALPGAAAERQLAPGQPKQ